jgi:hypothetical protein
MDIIAPYGQGQEVTVSFNVRGREYNGKYYNTLDAWKVQGEVTTSPVNEPMPMDDDLPFN